jgi:hypothetical protein
MGNKALKGSRFERWFCKELSLWWTENARDDVFWRTAGSGGRATNRGKKGHKTAGAYGDIAATDSCGEPLLRFFTFELKRGYQKDTVHDLLDRPEKAALQTYEKWILQAEESAKLAGSKGWAIITCRDRREPMILFPYSLWAESVKSGAFDGVFEDRCAVTLSIKSEWKHLLLLRLREFLAVVKPRHIKRALGAEA